MSLHSQISSIDAQISELQQRKKELETSVPDMEAFYRKVGRLVGSYTHRGPGSQYFGLDYSDCKVIDRFVRLVQKVNPELTLTEILQEYLAFALVPAGQELPYGFQSKLDV